MSYCPYCAKKLADGEVCTCRTPKEPAAAPLTPETELPAKEAAAEPEVTVTAAPETSATAEPTAPQQVEPAAPADPHADVNLGANMKKALSPWMEKCKKPLKDPKKRLVAIIVAAAVLLGLLGMIIGLSVAGNNYMQPINTLVKELNKGTDADYLTVAYAFGTKDFQKMQKKSADLLGDDSLESLQERLENRMESLTDELPAFKLTFEKKKAEKIEKSDLSVYQALIRAEISDKELEELEETEIETLLLLYGEEISESNMKKYKNNVISFMEDLQSAKVSKGYEVRGRFVVSDGKETVAKTDYVTLILLKIDGDWAVYSTKDYDSFSWESKNEEYDSSVYSFLTTYFNEEFSGMSPF